MRISLWQQFSSNHSGSFSVVGRFATESSAREAADKLREIIHPLDAWHADPANEAWFNEIAQNDLRPMTPIEVAIHKEYDVEWEEQGVDWYGEGHAPIRQIDRDVFFSVASTWCLPKPISDLLAKFGGQTYEEHEFGAPITSIVVRLTSTFDSVATASQIGEQIKKWMEEFNGANPPWAAPGEFTYADIGSVVYDDIRLQIEMNGVASLPALINWQHQLGASTVVYTLERQQHST